MSKRPTDQAGNQQCILIEYGYASIFVNIHIFQKAKNSRSPFENNLSTKIQDIHFNISNFFMGFVY